MLGDSVAEIAKVAVVAELPTSNFVVIVLSENAKIKAHLEAGAL
jgi:hypothetical protein